MSKKLITLILALIMIMSCISVVYAEKDNKEEEATQEVVATEKSEDDTKPSKTTEKEPEKTTEKSEDDTKPSKTTEKEPEKTTEKSEDDTKPSKTTEKEPEKTTERVTDTEETTQEEATEDIEDETEKEDNTTTKAPVKTTARQTVAAIKPTATLRKPGSDIVSLDEVEDYIAQDGDKYLDFRNEPNVTGELGYFGPEFSEGAGSMSKDTGLVIKATNDGMIGINFSENELKRYNYALVKIKSSDSKKPIKITMKLGDVTRPLNEWMLSNGASFPDELDTVYKTYALDLRGNGVSTLITHSTDASEMIENMEDDYDISFTAHGSDGADIMIESIVLTDVKQPYVTKTVSKKSLIEKIAFPLLLIVASAATLFVVNFIIYKRNKHNDNMVKRSKKNTGYKRR